MHAQTQRGERTSHAPYFIPRGLDPNGRLRKMSDEWRLRDGPQFFRQDDEGAVVETTPSSIQPGDFVELIGYADLTVTTDRELDKEVAEVGLAIEKITRLWNEEQLQVSLNMPSWSLLTVLTERRRRCKSRSTYSTKP